MAQPSLRTLVALINRSIKGATHGPFFDFIRRFFATWLKLDLTTLAAALTIFGTLSSTLQEAKGLTMKVYWWFTKFFTSSISIGSNDRLNREILNWVGAQIVTRQGTRILTAQTETIRTDAWYAPQKTERNDYNHEKRAPIQYLPTFGTTWFIHEYRVFMVQRVPTSMLMSRALNSPNEYVSAPEGKEPLLIMCLGRSVTPIKKFLETCRNFADKQREAYVTVRATKRHYQEEAWDTTILRPLRPLSTVHFDETTKQELVYDITTYLDPNTRRFYTGRGIPYRRGYLLHGTPGTGKTSLSLALAGFFGLELYLCHLPSIQEDADLQKLFAALSPRCMVLLEDIDAVGVKRSPDDDDEDEEEKKDTYNHSRSRCTLSGLLNVLDGVASQEGRIVLMTSNHADKLDKALIRPGRIDKMIFLGNISPRSAELMFLRMYAPENMPATILSKFEDQDLEKLAHDFSSKIPDGIFTPAQLQGYLLNRRTSPSKATEEISAWIEEEKAILEEAKVRAEKAKKQRAEKRSKAALKLLAKDIADAEVEAELERLEETVKAEKAEKAEKEQESEKLDSKDLDQETGVNKKAPTPKEEKKEVEEKPVDKDDRKGRDEIKSVEKE